MTDTRSTDDFVLTADGPLSDEARSVMIELLIRDAGRESEDDEKENAGRAGVVDCVPAVSAVLATTDGQIRF